MKAREIGLHGSWRVALAVAFALSASCAALARAEDRLAEERKQLAELAAGLADGMVGRRELSLIERLARSAEPTLRPRFEVLLARHEREYLGDAAAALRRLAPLLLSEAQLDEWRKADGQSDISARRGGVAARRADSPSKAVGPPPAFPPPHTWRIEPERVDAACEAAYAWQDLDFPERALAIVDAWGGKFSDWPRVRAAECAGDILLANGRTQPAVEAYRLALGILNQMSRRTERLNAEQRLALARVRGNLREAERRAKIERHGPGWYLYYEAENLRKTEGDPLRALWAFDRLAREYPKTVYAEAGRAYGIQVLLQLARADGRARAERMLADAAQSAAEQRARVTAMRRSGVAPRRVALAEEAAVALETRIKELQSLPRGPAAEREAFARAEAFLVERPRGLYRGETLLDLARWTLEEKLDLTTAQERYTAAWAWLEDIARGEAALDTYEVPREAAEVSRAPRAAVTADRMGNIQNVKIEPGMIVNRRTCAWYLDGLRAETALALGFLAWQRGENEVAAEWYARADRVDHRGRLLREQGWAGAGRRLKQALELGLLHASEEESRRYQGPQRIAVTLAEFHYCADRPERALAMTDRLLAGEFGPMDARKAQYPRLLRGLAQHARRDRDASIAELREALRGPWTITQDRAAFALANAFWGARRYEDSAKLLERLAGSGRSNDYVWRAQLALGLRLHATGQFRDALKWLDRVPESAPYHALAQQHAAPLKRAFDRK